jgi:YD repeat-containing protein
MKVFIQTIAILCFIISCSKDESLLHPAELDEPTAMTVFCQKSSNDTLRRVEYEYDNDNLITETKYYNGDIQSKTTFEYNSDNHLILETYKTDLQKTKKAFIYNELNQLINVTYKFTEYDSNGQIIYESESEAPLEYENNQLVKEWEYWGGFNRYEYKNGKVVTKIEYTKTGEKHHITTYKYYDDLLIEEKKETNVGGLIYLKSYKYDSQNRLTTIHDRENIIEENDYIEKRLIEKRTYYFGMDPGFDVCFGNYIYRYEY